MTYQSGIKASKFNASLENYVRKQNARLFAVTHSELSK